MNAGNRIALCLCCAYLACVGSALAQDADGWQRLFQETFDRWPVGPVQVAPAGWQAFPDGANRVDIVARGEDDRAARLVDLVSAKQDASCRLRHGIPALPGEYRISYEIMLRQGDATKLSQDMGLHLFDPGVLLDVFFSGDQMRTWQDGWTPLSPPVAWETGHWYRVEITLEPRTGTASIQVDGKARAEVPLRRYGAPLTALEFTCQRYAMGELWVDNVLVEHRPPAELRSVPGPDWTDATLANRRARWHADVGSRIRWGRLSAEQGGMAVARRALVADFSLNPILSVPLEAGEGTDVRLYLRRADTQEIRVLPTSPDHRYALFAETGWDGKVEAELIVVLVEGDSLKLADPEVAEPVPVEDHSLSAAGQFIPGAGKRPNAPSFKRLPLKVQGEPGPQRPVRFGIPFPVGALGDTRLLQLRAEKDGVLPLQTRVLSYWPDGTVRWLLVDTMATVPPLGTRQAVLEVLDDPPASGPPVGSVLENTIRLTTDDMSLEIPRNGFARIRGLPAPCTGAWDFVVVADGVRYRATEGRATARLEENGPVRGTVIVEGTLGHGDDDSVFTYECRLSLVRGSGQLQLSPTFELHGDLPERQVEETALYFGTNLAAGTVALDAEGVRSVSRAAGEVVRLRQEDYTHFRAEKDGVVWAEGTAASGWLQTGGIAVAIRRFREQFRKGLSVADHEIGIELWAPGGSRRFGRGAAKTHDVVLAFGAKSPIDAAFVASCLDRPTILTPSAVWLAATEGLGRFPLPGIETERLDKLYETACERRVTEPERRPLQSFDMVNYGEANHINSEIDAAVALYLQWARTGRRRWLDAALDWSLHSQDIDVCHWSPNPREIGIHHNHYPSDHNNGGLTLTHTWVRGQLFRYYLTGDPRSLAAATLSGRAYARNHTADGMLFDGGQRTAGIGSRGYGRGCWALSELYLATRNPMYLDTMRAITAYLRANLREDGAVPASHDAGGTWSRTDECPHMAAICAVGLARMIPLLPEREREPYVQDLRRIANWQVSRGAMPEKLGIMYHNYPGGEVIHFVDATSDMLEAWIALYRFTGDPLYRDVAESVYDNTLEMGDQWQHDWTMCARNILFYVAGWNSTQAQYKDPKEPAPAGADARFLASCQNEDGGFGPAPLLPSDMDSTYRALDALRLLKAPLPRAEACAQWILSCRQSDGGYAGEPGWHSNVAWTCMALRSLSILDVPPPDPERTKAWLLSCFQEDGGCGSGPTKGAVAYRPAWASSTEYTSYAVQGLSLLQSMPPSPTLTRRFLLERQDSHSGFNRKRGRAATYYTMVALDALRRLPASPQESDYRQGLLAWMSVLEQANGAYGYQSADHATLRNTYHMLDAFRSLQAELSEQRKNHVRRFVRRCRSGEGGFANLPGRTPTVVDTWYGVRLAVLVGPETAR